MTLRPPPDVSEDKAVTNLGTRAFEYKLGTSWTMHVIARPRLITFWEKHPDAAGPLRAWYAEATAATWNCSADIKERYSTASILNSERVVFNIGGNKYRLVVRINYASGTVFVRFLGTHKEYDLIDAEAV